MIDFSTEFGKQALKKLQSEYVIWLTTVTPTGSPQPRPVWFIWENNKIIIYSTASAKKLEHIRNNPNVSLHFNMASPEDDVYVLIGSAAITASPTPVLEVKDYITKYTKGIQDISMTPESFSKAYDIRIEITPSKLRGI